MDRIKQDLISLLPSNIEGWKAVEKDQFYSSETLHEYINGGAEFYVSYGVANVLSRTYSRPDQSDIVVDLFDMKTSRNAFGVFSHSRETIDDTFGQGSQYTEGLLLFWKDRYFVSILSSPETKESKKAVLAIARHMDAAILREGPLPEILTLIPQEALLRESIRFFYHYIWLNSHYFVADENILHIDEKTDAVLAKYGEQSKRYILLLVRYPVGDDAVIGFNDFVKHYLPELDEKSVVQMKDGTWTGCRLSGTLLIAVFNAPTMDTALQLMKAVQKNDQLR